MTARQTNKYIVLFLIGIISIIPIFLSNNIAAQYEFSNYAILQSCLFWLLFKFKEDRFKFLLSPSFLAVSYLNINFLIGSWVFKNDLVFTRLLPDYKLWEYAASRMFLFNTINFVIIISYFLRLNLRFNFKEQVNLNTINQRFLFQITLVSFFAVLIAAPYLEFIGFYITILKTVLALILITYAFKTFKFAKRSFFYLLIIFIFVLFSVDSKREAIFLVLPIILLESSKYKLSINFKQIIIFSGLIFSIFYFIIIMSILRNYGGFKADNFLEATTYVDDYIKSKNFVAGFMNNLEISSTYLHSNNVIEYIKKDKIDFALGETIIKPLFIILPRKYFVFKPRSAIDIYTTKHDDKFRNRGGSFPVSVQSELYLNFGYLSYIFALIFFTFFNGVYKNVLNLIKENRILNYVYLLYTYEIFLALIRGSGLDIFTVYTIIFIIFFFIYKLFLKLSYVFIK
ncbi:hypothetical protein [Lacinutrix sp. MedPE-SW]|uniref:hypothetical protein n=1 Tax=Lacinutrix sp. MedPE-SW TaxID=1860087 RepID=UPI00091C0F76|nr:hypothetical protein [Lacinutrix sp. MedPE-SW]OIQ23499.1 MAG: hypothetical protein BM549_02740 [Lacinutrix sp. MedPE-SW]